MNFQKQSSVIDSFNRFSEEQQLSIKSYFVDITKYGLNADVAAQCYGDLNSEVIKFAQNTDKESLTIENLNTHLAKSARSANLAAAGMQVLSAGANLGANILLSMAVSGVASFFDDLIHAEERAIEKECKLPRKIFQPCGRKLASLWGPSAGLSHTKPGNTPTN